MSRRAGPVDGPREPQDALSEQQGRETMPTELSRHVATVVDIVKIGCESCQIMAEQPPRVQIVQIEARETGWRTVGRIAESVGFCPSCGAVYAELHDRIPVECAEYPCPKCNKSDSLEYRIERIELAEQGHVFVASVECEACKRRSLFSPPA